MGGPLRLFRRRKEHYVSTDKEPGEDEHEEIEYTPVSVKDILTEMKDLTELVVDLGYSAAVLDSREITEEVTDLESRIRTLNYHIRLQAMMASRTTEDAEQMTGILQVANASEKIADAAAEIAKLTESDIPLRKFLPHLLKDADESLNRFRVHESSKATETTIGEAHVETETGNRIIAVRRRNTWIYGPGRRFQLAPEDTVICRGRQDGAVHLKAWLSGEEAEL